MNEQEKLNDRLMEATKADDLAALGQALADGADARANDSLALACAARLGHAECVKLLMEVSDPLADDSCSLRFAALNGHTECVRLLIPASDPLAKDSDALNWAAYGGYADCVKLLLPVSEELTEAAAGARAKGYTEVAGMIEAFVESQELSDAAQNAKPGPRVKSAL